MYGKIFLNIYTFNTLLNKINNFNNLSYIYHFPLNMQKKNYLFLFSITVKMLPFLKYFRGELLAPQKPLNVLPCIEQYELLIIL